MQSASISDTRRFTMNLMNKYADTSSSNQHLTTVFHSRVNEMKEVELYVCPTDFQRKFY